MASDLCFSLLSKAFDRESFDCGNPDLNVFLRRSARKHMLLKMSSTYVLHRKNESEILAYYAICMGQVELSDLAEESRKKLPHHPIPVVRIARLAVSASHRNKHYGSLSLMDAIHRALRYSSEIGAHAIEVHAADATARAFYVKYGFTRLLDDANHLYLPMSTAGKLLGG